MRCCKRGASSAAALTLGLTFASSVLAAPITPAPVVAAERTFAADGLALGIRDSFLKHAAPEGIVFGPEPVLARAAFQDAAGKDGPPLVWWPLWAGIARSGDLGFTTGPYSFDGKPGDPAGAAPTGSPVTYARPAERRAGSASRAMAQVAAAEAALHAAARIDAAKALLAVAAEDARFVGSRARPPASRAELAAELGRRAAAIQFAPMGGQASDAGDLVWTYGAARWTRDGADQRDRYVRIWRNDRAGWRLLFDELLPASPLKPPPVASPAG